MTALEEINSGDRIRSALSAQVHDVAESDLAYKEARQLAVSLHAKHYSDVKQWKPLDDLRGVILQIDNMVCGLVADQNADLVRMVDIAADRLIAIHKALHPEKHGINGIESPEERVAYMVGILQAAYDGVPAAPAKP